MIRKITSFVFSSALFLSVPFSLSGQDIESIKADTENYIFGEGWGITIEEADKQALNAILSQISIIVSNNFDILEGESLSDGKQEYERYVQNKISTFSSSTLTNTQYYLISNEPDAHVARWIKRTEIDRIFEGRKSKVLEYVGNAEKAESKVKLDDALRNYYWAYSLLKTLQHPGELKCKCADGEEHTLVSWIPEKIDGILDDIRPSVIERRNDEMTIYFSFRGKPVTSLDYSYFDGSHWSALYSAKDGKGILEFTPGAFLENIQIKYEFAYLNQSHIDKEIYSVLRTVRGSMFKSCYAHLSDDIEKGVANAVRKSDADYVREVSDTLVAVPSDSPVRKIMPRLVKALKYKSYDSVNDLFTEEGLDMYRRLISYGNATLLGEPDYSIYQFNDKVIVRSIPMSFSFGSGMRKSFIENVVFTFNSDSRIECLAFALDDIAVKDILRKEQWSQPIKKTLIEFLENYKTAFALKRLDFISTIFHDDAVIIIGRVARVARDMGVDVGDNYIGNKIVTRTRYTKRQYLDNLERCFNSNEFVNIRFADCDVAMAGVNDKWFGIQVKQDYYSSNYGDSGYLFLLVDFNEPELPIIHVRTWQERPDPVDGLFDMSSFDD